MTLLGQGRRCNRARSWTATATAVGLAALMACTSSSSNGPEGNADGGVPQCTATQACVGYPSFGNWVCLESCRGVDAGDCPSGEVCTTAGTCCTGPACSAGFAYVCVATDAGTGADGASDASSDGAEADGDGGLPQCTATQACVGYPSFGDWVCLESCRGVDAGDCPSGEVCTTAGTCCTGTACSAGSASVCVAADAGTGTDGASDASRDGAEVDGDGGFPQCTATQACVGYPSFGNWVCLESCGGVDGGDCASGQTCRSVSGCCVGTACSAVSHRVCVGP